MSVRPVLLGLYEKYFLPAAEAAPAQSPGLHCGPAARPGGGLRDLRQVGLIRLCGLRVMPPLWEKQGRRYRGKGTEVSLMLVIAVLVPN